jgi:hypothetical protein
MDPRKVVVTLVCATADSESLDDVVDGLSATGRDVGLVAGVDEQPRRVGEALERVGDLGILVVCASPRLDGAMLRKIEGLFSARRGPNHALIRIEISHGATENIAAIQRAIDAFIASHGRVTRRATGEDSSREVVSVAEIQSLARPAVRLEASEDIEGDTRRIELPDNPKAAELSRRRKVARERERERERITSAHRALTAEDSRTALPEVRAEGNADRVMIVVVVGAGVLAVIAGLLFAGVF